jgi:hypothetical protein
VIGDVGALEAIRQASPHQQCLVEGCPDNTPAKYAMNRRTVIHVFRHYYEYACGDCGAGLATRDGISSHRSKRGCGEFFIVDLTLDRESFIAQATAAGMHPDRIPLVAKRVGRQALPHPPAATPEVCEQARRRAIDRVRARLAMTEPRSKTSGKGKRAKRKSVSQRPKSSKAKKPRVNPRLASSSSSSSSSVVATPKSTDDNVNAGDTSEALPSTSATPDPPQTGPTTDPVEVVERSPSTSSDRRVEAGRQMSATAAYHRARYRYHVRQFELALGFAEGGGEGDSP